MGKKREERREKGVGRKRKPPARTPKISGPVERLIRTGIPGYDPCDQAEDCRFDEQTALAAVQFIEGACSHVEDGFRWSAGQPLLLEPWQKAIFLNLFGWKRPDGLRRYLETLIFIPRKNSKTTMAATIVIRIIFTDGEARAQCYSMASETDQATQCFDIVKAMIQQEPLLDQHAHIFRSSITVGSSFYKVLTGKASTKHGRNAHLVINDELHAQATRELTDAMATSTGSRGQPLMAHLTTSDWDREGSICNIKHDYASKVRDGIIDDPAFLPVIYEALKDDDWMDPNIWAKANPNLGISVRKEFIARECKRAQEEPTYTNEFLRLHLNLRTEQASRFIQMDKWDACVPGYDTLENPFGPRTDLPGEEILRGRPCKGALDLATVEDMAVFVLAFQIGEKIHLKPFFWCPEETAERRERKDRQPYLTWARQGFLELTPGKRIDYSFIRRRVNEEAKIYMIEEIGFDPWNASHLAQELQDEDGFEMVEYRQGYKSMNEPCKELLRLILGRQLIHGGHPILRWNASNAAATTDASDNIKLSKKHSGEKIDGLVATVMDIGLLLGGEEGGAECIVL